LGESGYSMIWQCLTPLCRRLACQGFRDVLFPKGLLELPVGPVDVRRTGEAMARPEELVTQTMKALDVGIALRHVERG